MSERRSNMPDTDPAPKPVSLADIAAALGVSTGTVDRALHGRAGVNPMTRSKVLKMASNLGYRKNMAASALAARRKRLVCAILPEIPSEFFGRVTAGVLEAAAAYESVGIRVEHRSCPWLKEGEAEAVEGALDSGASALIVAPGTHDSLRAVIRKASRVGVPVVCVATDAPGTERLTAVAADPTACGSMAAEMLGLLLQDSGQVAVITGSLATATHRECLEGFRAALARWCPGLAGNLVVEAHDDEAETLAKCREMLRSAPGLSGAYVATSTSMPVLRALDEAGLTGRVKVVTTDLFPALIDRIRAGDVAASIYQRPRNQGRLALQAVCRFLAEGVCPPAHIRFAPHVAMRSNVHLLSTVAAPAFEDVS
jgi:LacI family transcriptional regulator